MNNYPEPPEGYTPPHVAELMLQDIESYIDSVHTKEKQTNNSQKEVLSLLYMERSAILEIINRHFE